MEKHHGLVVKAGWRKEGMEEEKQEGENKGHSEIINNENH